jgi:tRNA 2-thiouridine synthesizing protein B
MTLHLFFTSPANLALLEECCAALREGDALLLLGEAAHAAQADCTAALRLDAVPDGIPVLALSEDCSARGISHIAARITLTDYAGFVSLACAHPRSVSWF